MANPGYGGTIVQLANIYTSKCFMVNRSLSRQVEPPSQPTTFHAGTWISTFMTKRSERRTWTLLWKQLIMRSTTDHVFDDSETCICGALILDRRPGVHHHWLSVLPMCSGVVHGLGDQKPSTADQHAGSKLPYL